MQGTDLTACTHPHRGVICACHRKDAHSVPAQGLSALTTRPVWSRLSRSHSDAAWRWGAKVSGSFRQADAGAGCSGVRSSSQHCS